MAMTKKQLEEALKGLTPEQLSVVDSRLAQENNKQVMIRELTARLGKPSDLAALEAAVTWVQEQQAAEAAAAAAAAAAVQTAAKVHPTATPASATK